MKTEVEFIYEKELKNDGIIEHAHIIAEASQQISEIAEARKRLRELKETIERHSKYIQDGKISFQTVGEFEWHKPIADYVTIHSIQGDFPEFIRPMTPKEIEEYCELEIPFEAEDSIVVHSKEEAERAKDRLKAVGWNVTDEELDARVTIVELPEKQESERGDVKKIYALDNLNPSGWVLEEDYLKAVEQNRKQEEESDQGDEDSFTDRPGFEEHHTKGDYFIKAPDSFNDAMMWTVLKHCGHGVAPDLIGFFYRESDAIKKVRELRKEANAFQEQTTADQIPVYKSLRDGTYFLLDNEGKRLPLTVLIEADLTITFIDPFDNDQFLVKRPEDIRLRDQEEETTFPKGWSIEPNSTGKWTVRGSWESREQVLGSHPTREAAEAYLKDYLASEAVETDQVEGDGLYIIHTGYSWEVRDKNDPQKGLMAYYPEREKAEIFVELYRKDNNLANVLSMVRKIYHQRHKEEQPQENLLNSTENYDVIENVDGSINARMKNEKKEMINEH